MVKRKIIEINEGKCNGCGLCISNCPEGALQIIDGKARLVSDLSCDGLGACLGHCPEGAITIEEREAELYDEKKVMENIIKGGENVIKAHLSHLKEHDQDEYLGQAIEFLKKKKIKVPDFESHHHEGCPGSKMMDLKKKGSSKLDTSGNRPSELSQWPIQMHLISPQAPYFKKADIVLSADCVGYSLGDFHKDHLKSKKLIIACPKLDDGRDVYVEKITSLIDDSEINTLTVMIMEVPCCSGLLQIAKEAASKAKRKIPIKEIVVGIQGNILKEEWVNA